MRIVALALLASAAAATPALAQEAAPTFSGAHVEVITGVDRVRGGGTGETGLGYGINAGYDLPSMTNTRFGIEGEYSDSTGKDCDKNVIIAGDKACGYVGRDLYAGGRVGFVSGNTLIYGKAGYTNASVGATYDDGVTKTRDTTHLDGVRVGAGLESNIGQFLVKAEYRYSNYEQGVSRHQGLVGIGMRF